MTAAALMEVGDIDALGGSVYGAGVLVSPIPIDAIASVGGDLLHGLRNLLPAQV
jgi:hypothetical protein